MAGSWEYQWSLVPRIFTRCHSALAARAATGAPAVTAVTLRVVRADLCVPFRATWLELYGSDVTGTLATLWRVCRSLVCVTAPTGGREKVPTSFRKSSTRAPSAGAQRDRPPRARAGPRTHQHPFRARTARHLPAGRGPDRSGPRPAL